MSSNFTEFDRQGQYIWWHWRVVKFGGSWWSADERHSGGFACPFWWVVVREAENIFWQICSEA
jgi:hypothetical protein